MEYKLNPIEIPTENPLQNDVLDREDSIDAMANLLDEVSGPFVLAINSPWGMGKTTFVNMLRQHLENQGFSCMYFDAWKSDYTTDPLVSFVAELGRVCEAKSGNEKAYKEVYSKTKKIVTILAKKILPIAGKLATHGLLDLSDVVENNVSELVANTISDSVDAYRAEMKLVDEFHDTIKATIQFAPGSKGKMIIFIDELDRCRPSYAIELLERVKHLFDVENVIFVLSIDKEQLSVSLTSLYGSGLNSIEYLRRFIDLEYLLPTPSSEQFTDSLFNRYGFEEYFSQKTGEGRADKHQLIETFNQMSQIFTLSLRAREQCFSMLRVIFLITPPNYFLYPRFLIPLIIMKSVSSEAYPKFIFGEGKAADILELLRTSPLGKDYVESPDGAVFEAFLILCKKGEYRGEPAELVQYAKVVKEGQKGEITKYSNEEVERAKRILRLTGELRYSDTYPSLDYIGSKLEIAGHFSRS